MLKGGGVQHRDVIPQHTGIKVHRKHGCGGKRGCATGKNAKSASIYAIDKKHSPEDQKQMWLDRHEQQRCSSEERMTSVEPQEN